MNSFSFLPLSIFLCLCTKLKKSHKIPVFVRFFSQIWTKDFHRQCEAEFLRTNSAWSAALYHLTHVQSSRHPDFHFAFSHFPGGDNTTKWKVANFSFISSLKNLGVNLWHWQSSCWLWTPDLLPLEAGVAQCSTTWPGNPAGPVS